MISIYVALGMFLMFLIAFNLVIVIAFYPYYFKPIVDRMNRKRNIMKMLKQIENMKSISN